MSMRKTEQLLRAMAKQCMIDLNLSLESKIPEDRIQDYLSCVQTRLNDPDFKRRLEACIDEDRR
jgi:hypothetical protein